MTPHTVKIPAEQAAENYLNHRRDEVSENTVRGETTPVRRFADWLDTNGKRLSELNGFDLQEFYDRLKSDDAIESKTTLRNYMGAVR